MDIKRIIKVIVTVVCFGLSYFLTWKYLLGFFIGIIYVIFLIWFQKETIAMLNKIYNIQKSNDEKINDDEGKIVRKKLKNY